MAALATLVLRMALATFAVLWSITAADTLISPPYIPSPALAGDDGPIWTSQPVRVDRSNQTVERLPDLYPFKFLGSRGVKVVDNATFTLNGDTYLIQDMDRINPKALCRSDKDRLLACGALAQAALRSILQRGYIECHRRPAARSVYLVNCHSGGRSLAERVKYPASTGLLASVR